MFGLLKPTPDRFPDFQTVSRARHFAFGQGLTGSAWQSRTVVHYPELSLAQNCARLSVAASEHLRTGVAFPLYVGKRVLGVIEMFNAEPRDLAPATQEFLFALGGQIGVFLERFYAGRTLQAADAQFVLLAEAASLAIFTIDDESGKLTVVMPEYLRHVHEQGLARYVATGQRHVSWDGVALPGLHKNGHEIPLVISFGEFVRAGKRVFTGFATLT